jgi:hypothetical protein
VCLRNDCGLAGGDAADGVVGWGGDLEAPKKLRVLRRFSSLACGVEIVKER